MAVVSKIMAGEVWVVPIMEVWLPWMAVKPMKTISVSCLCGGPQLELDPKWQVMAGLGPIRLGSSADGAMTRN